MSRLLSRGGSLFALLTLLVLAPSLHAVSPDLVISQVYGGGGNSGAPLTHDFVELFNRGVAPVSLDGLSIQYASATGTGNFGATSTQLTELPAGTLHPGHYFLIQQAGGTTGVPLPTPDHIDPTPIAMAAGSGKVALVSGTSSLGCNGGSTECSSAQLARILDLVGFGSANFFEGSGGTPTLNNSTAAFRAGNGCIDTDDNAADFTAGAPAPRTMTTPPAPCAGAAPVLSVSDVTLHEGDSGVTPFPFVVTLSSPAPAGGVSFAISTADGTATIADTDYVGGGSPSVTIPENEQAYNFTVDVIGDKIVEPNETFFVDISDASGAEIGKGRGVGTILNDDVAPSVFEVSISQIYGGGGNAGAPLTHDFVELFNRGNTTVSLGGWSVQYSSAGGSTWQVTPLSGSIAPGGYYLIRLAAGSSCSGTPCGEPLPIAFDAAGSSNMGAASGRVALSSSTAPFISASCPAGAPLVDLVGFGSASCFEGSAAAPQASNSTAVHRVRGGCIDSNDNRADFITGGPNPRSTATAPRSCEFVPAAIHQIQGAGLVTPYLGLDVTTTGIVTALKGNGFFLQTPDSGADADPATSEGIFVFTSSTPTVSAGDFVTVSGTATEFFDLTQIAVGSFGTVAVSSTGSALPAPVVLTSSILDSAGTVTQLERLEGMRVHADALVSVAPSNGFGETFAVLSGVARPMREPGIENHLPVPPDPSTGLVDCCVPRWDRNPERIMIDSDGLAGAPFMNVTSNVTITNVTGPLDYTFGDYKITPEAPPATTANMSAVAVPVPAAGDFTVAAFNIENFRNDNTQRVKAALAIREVMRYPDVIGHVEIASLGALEALAAQVNGDAVNAGDPDPGYVAYLIPATPSATQNLGFLVKSARVRVDDITQEPAGTYTNPNTGLSELLHDRPPLILRATVDPETRNSRSVIVLLLHNRSFIDVEGVSGEGVRVRAKRTAQAEAIAAILQQLQTDNAATPVIALGDYNAFEFNDGFTDPLSVIKGDPTPGDQVVVPESPDLVTPNFVNLTESLVPEERYTFIFEGTPQALDHVVVSSVGAGYVTRYAIARANADFPEVPASLFAADPTRPEASSDHDMPVAAFRFPAMTAVSADPAVIWPPNGKMVDVNLSYDTSDRCGIVTTTISVSSNEPAGAGDWEVIDDHRVRLRATRNGAGTDRIYTITVTVTDSCGLSTEETVTVTVPHDQRR